MIINANTKIATILKQEPDALEAIINISPMFTKLRNPIIRKLMAGRTSLAMAAKAGGCSIADFYDKLKPLGFEIDNETLSVKTAEKSLPHFIISLKPANIIDLDVRPIIASGKDPLHIIIEKIKTIQPGQAIKIINSFEPVPLILLLEKKGFASYTETIKDHLTHTFFYKEKTSVPPEINILTGACKDWHEVLLHFKEHIKTIDVRALEMPLPMVTILNELESLPAEAALFVHHKRIPVFLLPELADRKFDYRIKEICDGEVDILIFKN